MENKKVNEVEVNTIQQIEDLKKNPSAWNRKNGLRYLAMSTNDAEALEMLSKINDKETKYWVGMNVHTPIEVLKKLSLDRSEIVRVGVAKNPNTPKEILMNFLADSDEVRSNLISNPNTPQEAIDILKRILK